MTKFYQYSIDERIWRLILIFILLVLKTILWAPALDIGASTKLSLVESIGIFLLPFFMTYIGGVLPTFIVPLVQKIAALVCLDDFGTNLVCLTLVDIIFGPGYSQQTVVSMHTNNIYIYISFSIRLAFNSY